VTITLPKQLRDLVELGPLTYVSTTNADGSPHVTAIWIGLDGDDLISTHMRFNAKLRNMRLDPRVVLSFAPPQRPGDWMSPHAIIHANRHHRTPWRDWATTDTTCQGLRRTRCRVPGPISDRVHSAVLDRPDRRRGPMGQRRQLTVDLRMLRAD